MNWQPIETVPLWSQSIEPETVLLYGPRFGVQIGTATRFSDGEIISHVNGFSGNWPVTYWMPLPAPPSPYAATIEPAAPPMSKEPTSDLSFLD